MLAYTSLLYLATLPSFSLLGVDGIRQFFSHVHFQTCEHENETRLGFFAERPFGESPLPRFACLLPV
jgi:hypothetical protein